MTRRDPMLVANAQVREFAARHRLRHATRDDGEVALLLGPRTARPAVLGRDGSAFPLDGHASFGLRPSLWTLFVGPTSSRRVGMVVARWRSLGLTPHELDFEAWVDVSEDRLLDVADAHSLTRPQRRRTDSPETRAAATARLAEVRSRPARSDPLWNGTSEASNRFPASEPTSRPSGPAGVDRHAAERAP